MSINWSHLREKKRVYFSHQWKNDKRNKRENKKKRRIKRNRQKRNLPHAIHRGRCPRPAKYVKNSDVQI